MHVAAKITISKLRLNRTASTNRKLVPQQQRQMTLSFQLILLAVIASVAAQSTSNILPTAPPACTAAVRRSIDWGAGSNSYGIEGATRTGGRTPSVWDTYQAKSGAIADGAKAGVAIDFYKRYQQDVALMKRLGLKHFRMSISWSRLLPGAKKGSTVNPEAVTFYSSLLDELQAAGIQPMVALYHWDLPQSLQDSYQGFLSPTIVDDFAYYADTCFRLFGNRVKRWLTFIEPYVICNMQYGNGQYAPGVDYGDTGRYRCGHNVLLAHAAAVQLYRQKYKAAQGGQVSFTTLVTWPEPLTGTTADKRAAQNMLDAEVGWFLDPIYFGDYPASLKATKGQYLPTFTTEQRKVVQGSLDYIAVNCFTAKYVSARPGSTTGWRQSKTDKSGKLIGPASGVSWINVVPWTQAKMLKYISQRYSSTTSSTGRTVLPAVLISSSGTQVPGEEQMKVPGVLQDDFRVNFYREYLNSVCKAVIKGDVNLVAWYAWSLFDGFEWTDGYRRKFGLVHVQYAGPQGTPADVAAAGGGLKRTPKNSALWLSQHFFKQ